MQFSFIMFDELKTGYISHKEVEEILRGNHMIGILSVQRKADTVMRQAATQGAGSITMNEFVVVSKKVPQHSLADDRKTEEIDILILLYTDGTKRIHDYKNKLYFSSVPLHMS